MGFSKGGGKSKQTSTVDPLVQEAVEKNLGRADSLYENMPMTPQAYSGQRVADINSDMYASYDKAREIAGGSAVQGQFDNYLQGAMQAADSSGVTGAANDMMSGQGLGQGDLSRMAQGGSLGSAMDFAAGGPSVFRDALANAAQGQVNPAVSEAFKQAAGDLTEVFNEQVMPGINDTFSTSGRTGSGMEALARTDAAGELSDSLQGMAANMYGTASENALNRGLTAAQSGLGDDVSRRNLAASLYGGQEGRGLGAAQALQSGAQSGMSTLGNVYGIDTNRGVQAAGLAPQSQAMQLRGMDALQRAGESQMNNRQARLDASKDMYDENAQRGIKDYERQMQHLMGTTGMLAPMAGAGQQKSNQKGKGK